MISNDSFFIYLFLAFAIPIGLSLQFLDDVSIVRSQNNGHFFLLHNGFRYKLLPQTVELIVNDKIKDEANEYILKYPMGGLLTPKLLLRFTVNQIKSDNSTEHTAKCAVCNFLDRLYVAQTEAYQKLPVASLKDACSSDLFENIPVNNSNYVATICTCAVDSAFPSNIMYNFQTSILDIKYRIFTTDIKADNVISRFIISPPIWEQYLIETLLKKTMELQKELKRNIVFVDIGTFIGY